MPSLGHLICLTPRDSYLADNPACRRGPIGWLEARTGPFVRSPGIAFPYLVGFLRRSGALPENSRVVVQHDKIEGAIPFERVLRDKIDPALGDHDVLFITSYTDSIREAYRRAREARAAWRAAGRGLTIAVGGAHASALPDEGVRHGHVDAGVPGEGEWSAARLLADVIEGRPVQPVYREPFRRIRDRGALSMDTSIWDGLTRRPHQIVASTTFARGCKLDCHFCAVFLTNGPTVRNRDIHDVVAEIASQTPMDAGALPDAPGIYNAVLRAIGAVPLAGPRLRRRLARSAGPGFTRQFFFWDDNLYNAAGSAQALFEAVRPLGRPWAAELTIDIAEKPELLKLAYDSGCRDLFLGIESVSQQAIDGLDKWSNDTSSMSEMVRRVHDAGINVMGSFVFGLDGDDDGIFDRTLEFIQQTGIDFVVANIVQPYPGTGTFRDAVAEGRLLPWTRCPGDADVGMDHNWALFDGAHVLVRPRTLGVQQLQEGYRYFLRQAYSLTGIMRRFRGTPLQPGRAAAHMARNYLLSRYGMSKTAHALRDAGPVWTEQMLCDAAPPAEPGAKRPEEPEPAPALTS
ncbi:MAG TPA: hypothetical protein VJV23_02675 [Candidatus Polarisedimenticolia bacterium]|nr:hypothetical protein [Candidatus Polarisedimenticolia bacterium]